MPLGPVIVPDVFGDVPVVSIGKIQKQLQTSLLQQRGGYLYTHGIAVGVAGGAVFAAGTLLILVLYCYMRTA